VAGDTLLKLGSVADFVEEMQLEVAQSQFFIARLA